MNRIVQEKLSLIKEGKLDVLKNTYELSRRTLPSELSRYYDTYKKSIVRIMYKGALDPNSKQYILGTGFFIRKDIIITSAHLFAIGKKSYANKDDEIFYEFDDATNNWYTAYLAEVDQVHDIAILIANTHFDYINTKLIHVDYTPDLNRLTDVYIIGFPGVLNHAVMCIHKTKFYGIVEISSIPDDYGNRYRQKRVLGFKDDAELNPGNLLGGFSGSPIIDLNGNIISIFGYEDIGDEVIKFGYKLFFGTQLLYLQKLVSKYDKNSSI